MSSSTESTPVKQLRKTPTGIGGFDEITGGGVPQGRPTLICGGPGSGKTLFGMEFLVRGARDFDEPGVFMSFEERDVDLIENFSSLGFDLDDLIARDKIALDYVHIERSEIFETGEFDLEGLFVGSVLPSIPLGPGGSCWTRSRPFSPDSPMRPFSGRKSGGFSGGSKTGR